MLVVDFLRMHAGGLPCSDSVKRKKHACPGWYGPHDALRTGGDALREGALMIAAMGISVMDIILVLDGFREGEGSFHCSRLLTEGGGMAATALCAAARLGSSTRLLSRVGDDIHGRFIIDGLRAFDVDTAGVAAVPGRHTTVSIVLVDRNTGEKQFYSEWEKSAYIDPVTADLSLLDGAGVLLVDGHWTDQAFRGARWAREHGVPVVADFKRRYEGLDEIFPLVDYLIIPRCYFSYNFSHLRREVFLGPVPLCGADVGCSWPNFGCCV